MRTLLRILLAAIVVHPAVAENRSEEQVKLQRAEAVLKASLEAPDQGIPKEALEKAECVGVFPDVKKGAFIVGGQETDLVLLVVNEGGMNHLLKDRFTLGAEATATAGPVGRTLKAATDAQLQAQILSWSRSQGAFVGAALDGSVLTPDVDANERIYGKGATAKAILLEHTMSPPPVATAYLKVLNAGAKRG